MSANIHTDIIGNGCGGSDAAYNQTTGALNVAEVNQPRFGDVLESLLDITNLPIGANYYYPSVDGFCMLGFNASLSFTGKIIADPTTTVILTIEATNDESITDWITVTELFVKNDNTTSNTNITVNNTTVLYGLKEVDPTFNRYRVRIQVQNAAVNTITIKMLRKAK